MGICGFVHLKRKGCHLENFTVRELSCQVGPSASQLGYCLGTWRREKDIWLPTPVLFPSLSVADCQQDVGSSSCCLACADPRFLPLRCLVVSRKEGRGLGDSLIVGVHLKCWGKCVCVHACMFGGVSPPLPLLPALNLAKLIFLYYQQDTGWSYPSYP